MPLVHAIGLWSVISQYLWNRTTNATIDSLSAELKELDESNLVEYLSNCFPFSCLDLDEKCIEVTIVKSQIHNESGCLSRNPRCEQYGNRAILYFHTWKQPIIDEIGNLITHYLVVLHWVYSLRFHLTNPNPPISSQLRRLMNLLPSFTLGFFYDTLRLAPSVSVLQHSVRHLSHMLMVQSWRLVF